MPKVYNHRGGKPPPRTGSALLASGTMKMSRSAGPATAGPPGKGLQILLSPAQGSSDLLTLDIRGLQRPDWFALDPAIQAFRAPPGRSDLMGSLPPSQQVHLQTVSEPSWAGVWGLMMGLAGIASVQAPSDSPRGPLFSKPPTLGEAFGRRWCRWRHNSVTEQALDSTGSWLCPLDQADQAAYSV